MPDTLNELLKDAITAVRGRDMAKLRRLQDQLDMWLIDAETRDAHETVLAGLVEVLDEMEA